MEVYKIPIEYAIIIFPFIAFLLTIPFLIYQYRKYGSIPILRSIIFYSFILYLLTAYFMVILPFPDRNYVANLKTPTTQLIPFSFIGDILKETSFNIKNISTYLPTLEDGAVYTVIFNLILTLPFGVYLRYYFNCKWYKTIVYSFILSLFFELTQLSGLYGLYPRPYRLFDVDDLIINTTGGLIGFFVTPLFMKILPSKESLDIKSYEKGKKVTLFRRIVAFLIDIFFITIFIVIFSIITYNTDINKYSTIIIITIYYLIIPPFIKGQTIGKKIVKIELSNINDKDVKWYQIFTRYLLGYFLILLPNIWANQIIYSNISNKSIVHFIKNIILIFQILNYISLLILPFVKDKRLLYEKITFTKNTSTIISNELTENTEQDEHIQIQKEIQCKEKNSISKHHN